MQTFHGVLLVTAVVAIVVFAKWRETYEDDRVQLQEQITQKWDEYTATYTAKLKPAEKARFKKTQDLVWPKVVKIVARAQTSFDALTQEDKLVFVEFMFFAYTEMQKIRLSKENKSVMLSIGKDIWKNIGTST